MAVLAFLCAEREESKSCYQLWAILKVVVRIGFHTDSMMLAIVLVSRDIRILGETDFIEIIARMCGYICFALIVLIIAQPMFVSINYQRINHLLAWYVIILGICLLVILTFFFCSTISFNIAHYLGFAVVLAFEIAYILYPPAKNDSVCQPEEKRNCLETYHTNHLVYAAVDICNLVKFLERLEWIDSQFKNERSETYLAQLQWEKIKLFIRATKSIWTVC